MRIHVYATQQAKPFVRAVLKRPTDNLLLVDFEPNPLSMGLKVRSLERLPEPDRIAFYASFNHPGVEARIELVPTDDSEQVFLQGPYYHRNEPDKPEYEGLSLVIASSAFWEGTSESIFL